MACRNRGSSKRARTSVTGRWEARPPPRSSSLDDAPKCASATAWRSIFSTSRWRVQAGISQ
eukprot:910042-Pyramimonas_sp.AAC.1